MVFNHPSTASLFKAADFISVPTDQVITGTLILLENSANQFKPILCVHRLNDDLNIKAVTNFYGIKSNQIKIVKSDSLNQYFDDCLPKVSLPLGEPYGMTCLIDSAIKHLPYVYFSGGGHTSLIRLTREDFIYLTTQFRFFSFAFKKKASQVSDSISIKEKEKIEKLDVSVGLPDYVLKIVEMAKQQVSLENFESLLYQHVTFLPLFYPASSASIRDKFCMVSHVAAKTARKSFYQIQDEGPLALKAVWQNSVCSAEIAKTLSQTITLPNFSFSSELAFYCGLFHHFGYLPYGALYAPEFNLLNCLWASNQHTISIVELEKRILTLGQEKKWINEGHTKMGEALLSSWQLDPIVVTTAAHHHHVNYDGQGAQYVRLIYLVDQLLAHFGLGDGILPINENLLIYFGLSLEHCIEISSKIVQSVRAKNDINSAFARPNRAH